MRKFIVLLLCTTGLMTGCSNGKSETPVAATAQTTQTQSEAEISLEAPGEAQSNTPMVEPEKDSEAPIINVSNTRIEVTEGVSALDGKDGDLTSQITASAVDVAVLGAEQTIKYSVTDAAGNEATAEATLLIKADPIEVLDKTMYATSAVNVRSQSNQDSDKVSSLSFAESVHVTGKDKTTGWYRIQLKDGSTGYVSNKYLSDTKPTPKPAPTQTKPSTGGTQSKPSNSGGSSQSQPSGGGNSGSTSSGGAESAGTSNNGRPAPTKGTGRQRDQAYEDAVRERMENQSNDYK